MPEIEGLGTRIMIPADEPQAFEMLPESEVFVGWQFPPSWLARAKKLKWIQSTSSLERFPFPELRASPVLVTAIRGIFSDLISDHVMGLMLSFSRGLHQYLRRQLERQWDPGAAQPGALGGSLLGILGFGGIGTEVAHRAHAFGMRIRALDPAPKARPDYIESIHPPTDLRHFLSGLDYLVICAPLTPETERMLDAEALRMLDPSAILINVGRARLLDMDALKDALRSRRLAGAALDVFEKDPLPAEDPLWTMENVVLTPHVGARSPLSAQRRDRAVIENVRRYRAGEPLLDVVDKNLEYVV
jgi:phosphoglycerate dehydrogenase-like enzyme